MVNIVDSRRRLLTTAGLAGTSLLMGFRAPSLALAAESRKKPGEEKEIGAVEDLMREHGVLRRALLVYIETVPRLRVGQSNLPLEPIARTAKLFRSFGEDYHERKLEEAHIFPVVKRAGGTAAAYVEVLKAQHDRGREVTDYILTVAGKGSIGTGDAEPLARAFESFVLMYQNHTAREDTIVFPAWKDALSERQLREMGDKFEDIEHRTFGKDGFDDAVTQIGEIEQALGLADISQFTAPPPPKA
ncbi:MAG: hemerythrin domain-containing protein [Alphaproteobacteria bacterium]|nr:hemerythrin domain-containing protein [Alphaproteobacteria bacterium]